MRVYSWNEQNLEHIGKHNVTPGEARHVIEHARPPYPEFAGNGKWCVKGKTRAGRWLQVIYVEQIDSEVSADSLPPADLIAYSEGAAVLLIIHARDLAADEKRRVRKRG